MTVFLAQAHRPVLALNVRRLALYTSMAVAAIAGGCSNDGAPGLFSTGTIGSAAQATPAKASADPVCMTLAAQIGRLRQDGSVDRLEKAATGKSQDVSIKRSSLATQAQLNKTNADFIAKCGPNLPQPAVTAAATPTAPAAMPMAKVAKASAKVAAAALPVAAKDAGVTVAPPQATAPQQ